MRGCLLVDCNLHNKKFSEIYNMLITAFESRGASIDVKTNIDIIFNIDKFVEEKYDFVLFWNKDVNAGKMLENRGVRIFNSSNAIDVCDHKGLTFVSLMNSGVDMPKTILAPKTYKQVGYPSLDFLTNIEEILGFPMVIKESRGSFGKQVYLVKTHNELVDMVENLAGNDFIFQQYISTSHGRDVRIEVVGNKVVAAALRNSVDGDFRSNATLGGKMTAYSPSESQIQMAEKVSKLLGLDFAGVDILFGENGKPILCEVNSNAHFKNLFDATGIDTANYIADYIIKESAK